MVVDMNCPVCGKLFGAQEPWGFMMSGRKVCSWKCLRKMQTAKKNKTPKRLDPDERREVMEMIKAGVEPKEIALRAGVTLRAILYYVEKGA